MQMLSEKELLEIGVLGKVYGREGALKLRVEEYYLPFLLEARFAFIYRDGGFVPYEIEWLELTNPPRIKLDAFNTPEQALAVVAHRIALLRKDVPLSALPASTLKYAFLQDYELIDRTQGSLGLITEVRAYPKQEMAVLDLGEEEEVLIPLHEQLIVSIDKEKAQVLMDLPQGLVK